MAHVFISYSRKDGEFVHRLDDELRRRGREAWVDWEGIRALENWEETIYAAIEGADTFIFALTPDSVASEICGREIKHAAAHNKRMVPLVARDVKADTVHESLAKLNWIFCRDSDDFQKAADTLVSALDTDLAWVHAHTDLLTQAIKWEANSKSRSLVLRGEALKAAEQWLAQAGAQKERQPTALQTEYILTSRRASNRRLRVFLGIAAAVTVITVILAVVATYQRGIAQKQTARAEQRTREVSQTLSRSDFLEATRRLSANETGAALAHLARSLRIDPSNKDAQRRLISLLSQRNWQFPALEPLVLNDGVWSAEFSPDGKRIVTTLGSEEDMVQLWNADTGEKTGEPFTCPAPIIAARFNSDGSRIAVIWNLNLGDARVSSRCQMLDGITGKPIGESTEHAGTLSTSAFAKDGKRLLLGYDLGNGAGEVCARDAVAGGPLQTLLTFNDAVPAALDATAGMVITLGHEPQQRDEEKGRIARVWNLRTGKPITTAFKHDQDLRSAIFSPDGDHIATHSLTHAFVWDLAADSLIASTGPLQDELYVRHIGYSPDAKLLLVVGVGHLGGRESDWIAQLHDAKTGELIQTGEIRDHGVFKSAAFSEDSQFLLLCSSGYRARVWRTQPADAVEPEEATAPLEHSGWVTSAKFSPDGKRVVTASFGNTLRAWHVTLGLGRALPEKIPAAQPVWFTEASPLSTRIAMISDEPPGVQIFDAETLQRRSPSIPQAQSIAAVAFSGDDRLLAICSKDGTATVWDTSDGRLVTDLKHTSGGPISSVKLDATGGHAAIATPSGATVWDLAANRAIPLTSTPKEQNPAGVAFSPDRARLLTVHDSELNLWDAGTGARIWGPLPRAGASDDCVSFSPDGKHFALCGAGGVVEVRETASGKPAYRLQHRGTVGDAVFSRDGKLIATCAFAQLTSGYAQVWDAATGVPITDRLVAGEIHRVVFSPDGELLAATEKAEGVRIWSIATGRECFDVIPHGIAGFAPTFSRDGKRLLTVINGIAQFHELWVPSGDAPAWLPDLAESVGGFSVNANGVVGPVDKPVRKLNEVRTTIARAQGNDPLLHWVRWFLADRTTRTISPFSQRTMTDEVAVKVGTSKPVPIISAALTPAPTLVPTPVATLTPSSRPPVGPKRYRLTGVILEWNDSMIAVQKGNDRWEIARDSNTNIRGDLKSGAKVTTTYVMTASEVGPPGSFQGFRYSLPRRYQATGALLEVSDSTIAFEKQTGRWEVARNSNTNIRGDLNIGAKVTLTYIMTATDVEVKPAHPTPEIKSPHQ
jgi:WD40 repeat protein